MVVNIRKRLRLSVKKYFFVNKTEKENLTGASIIRVFW